MSKFAFALTAFLSFAAAAAADLIAIGLDWRKNVYVQEFWREDVPYYAIANLGKDPVTISLHERQGNLLAGPWVVRAKSTLTMDARMLIDKGLINFRSADGGSFGLMPAPTKATAPKGVLASFDGLNSSGGRQTTMWIEQATETVPADKDFTVTLKVPGNAGLIKWSQKPEMNGPLSQLPLLEATSATLPIGKNKDMIEIDTNKPIKNEAIHTVTLRFRAPAAESETMALISGWRQTPNGGGHGVTRGILIAPAKK